MTDWRSKWQPTNRGGKAIELAEPTDSGWYYRTDDGDHAYVGSDGKVHPDFDRPNDLLPIAGLTIEIREDPDPPIRFRNFWSGRVERTIYAATIIGTVRPTGHGRTQADAVANLIDKIAEGEPC